MSDSNTPDLTAPLSLRVLYALKAIGGWLAPYLPVTLIKTRGKPRRSRRGRIALFSLSLGPQRIK